MGTDCGARTESLLELEFYVHDKDPVKGARGVETARRTVYRTTGRWPTVQCLCSEASRDATLARFNLTNETQFPVAVSYEGAESLGVEASLHGNSSTLGTKNKAGAKVVASGRDILMQVAAFLGVEVPTMEGEKEEEALTISTTTTSSVNEHHSVIPDDDGRKKLNETASTSSSHHINIRPWFVFASLTVVVSVIAFTALRLRRRRFRVGGG